jgi:hypothetical protein
MLRRKKQDRKLYRESIITFKIILTHVDKNKTSNDFANMLTVVFCGYEDSSNFYVSLYFYAFLNFLQRTYEK